MYNIKSSELNKDRYSIVHALNSYGNAPPVPRWLQNVNRNDVEKVRQEEKELDKNSKVNALTVNSVI